MAVYKFCLLKSGWVAGVSHRECNDDMDALDRARKLCKRYDIEIWRDEKWVARLREGDEPIYVRD